MNKLKHSEKAKGYLARIDSKTKLGDLRKFAKEIKKDHELAVELWADGRFLSRQLSILIMDCKLLTEKAINDLVQDIDKHPFEERLQLIDWLMANQLLKDRKIIALIDSWEESPLSLLRRVYWYYQARLRWVGQNPPGNSAKLLNAIENSIDREVPEVQWAMNFTAGWIGVFEPEFRSRCIDIGKKTGLFKDQIVSKGCTPDYLPDFITIESKKRNL